MPEACTDSSRTKRRGRIQNSEAGETVQWGEPAAFPGHSGIMRLAETTLHHGNQPLTQCQHPLRRHLVERAFKYQKRQPVHCGPSKILRSFATFCSEQTAFLHSIQCQRKKLKRVQAHRRRMARVRRMDRRWNRERRAKHPGLLYREF